MSTTILRGPQRFTTTVGATVRSLGLSGRIAMVNSGWQERESDDAELAGHLDGRGVNLRLHHRMLDVLAKDEYFAAAALAFRDSMDELRAFYGIRLQAATDAVQAVAHRTSLHAVGPAEEVAAIEAVREVDRWYAAELAGLYASLRATARRDESGIIGWHRGEVGAVLDECEGVVVAGGNVRTLLRTLRLFGVAFRPEQAVTPHGVTAAEVHDTGLGRLPGVVALPHAKRRLRLDDHERMSVLARRFAEHRLLLLDDGAVVRFHDGATELPAGARVIDRTGQVSVVVAA